MPFANCLCILDSGCQCIVPMRQETDQATKVLSAIQLAKGVRKNEETFLPALKINEAPKDMSEIPPKVLDVLESFKDVMPSKLPKQLPPKREVDHKIELVPNVQPLARTPYRMSPPELEELRK